MGASQVMHGMPDHCTAWLTGLCSMPCQVHNMPWSAHEFILSLLLQAGTYEGRKGASRFLIALATEIHVESHAVHWRAVAGVRGMSRCCWCCPQIASFVAASAAGLNVFIAGSSTFGEEPVVPTPQPNTVDWLTCLL